MNVMPRSEASDDPFAGSPAIEPARTQPGFQDFLRALADEVDVRLGAAERDAVLRATGRRMARLLPIPPVASLEALQMEMDDRLGRAEWGSVRLTLQMEEACLVIVHGALPRIGSAGDPPGTWLLPVLEGLYQEWLANQPGGDPGLEVRRRRLLPDNRVVLRCARPHGATREAAEHRRGA